MNWRLRHWLFGTHFVALRYGYSDHALPVRFTLEPRPRPYVRICGENIWLEARAEKWEALTFDKAEFLNRIAQPTLRVVGN